MTYQTPTIPQIPCMEYPPYCVMLIAALAAGKSTLTRAITDAHPEEAFITFSLDEIVFEYMKEHSELTYQEALGLNDPKRTLFQEHLDKLLAKKQEIIHTRANVIIDTTNHNRHERDLNLPGFKDAGYSTIGLFIPFPESDEQYQEILRRLNNPDRKQGILPEFVVENILKSAEPPTADEFDLLFVLDKDGNLQSAPNTKSDSPNPFSEPA